MNPCYKLFCRVYQGCFRLALPLLPYREPRRYDSVDALKPLLTKLKPAAVLLVTDRGIRNAGLTAPLENLLRRMRILCVIYDHTQPNPTVQNVEEALEMYMENGCGCIIALGGGSSMDCAKAVGTRAVYPRKSLSRLKGLLRVWRKLPPLIAIPTTAGTGSEVTLAAVITDPVRLHKYTLLDFTLIPRYAVLDPMLTASLPPSLTAATGMDALTHAVEAYIGRSTTRETRQLALNATETIFSNLEKAYQNGHDLTARRNMLTAAYQAGVAFSKSYVGYVHAIAHSLGGQYNMPHGQTNAVLLPYLLRGYGKAIHKKLKQLALAAKVANPADSPALAADKFITAVEEMNARMGIPRKLSGVDPMDIPQMAAHAEREANPLYPVPVLMDKQQLAAYYQAAADWSESN